MGLLRLPYIDIMVTAKETIWGYQMVQGCNQYKDVYIRNRVIMRVDLMYLMTDYFTVETIEQYRTLIFKIMAGEVKSKEKISLCLTQLYAVDEQFKKFLTEVVYEDNELEDSSLYSVIVNRFKKTYMDNLDTMYELMRLQRCKTLFDSEGYLYVGVPDEDVRITLPGYVKEEILSRGKIWNGNVYKQR